MVPLATICLCRTELILMSTQVRTLILKSSHIVPVAGCSTSTAVSQQNVIAVLSEAHSEISFFC